MAEKELKIRDFLGDYALDIPTDLKGSIITLYFNSRCNAENVKRIIEVDGSKPNEAPVCDMQEVVRCKDCKKFCPYLSFCADNCIGAFGHCQITHMNVSPDFYCGHGENKDGEQE